MVHVQARNHLITDKDKSIIADGGETNWTSFTITDIAAEWLCWFSIITKTSGHVDFGNSMW